MTTKWTVYRGYTLSRGAYVGTSDDNARGWYIDPVDSDTWDRRGPGYRTRREAMSAITCQTDTAAAICPYCDGPKDPDEESCRWESCELQQSDTDRRRWLSDDEWKEGTP
jgi:hypothetical protein